MIAIRFYTRHEIERKLRPYRCRLHEALPDGTEVWLTGWDQPFTLNPETGVGEPRYDDWQFREVMATVIARTMPEGFEIVVDAADAKPHIVRGDVA